MVVSFELKIKTANSAGKKYYIVKTISDAFIKKQEYFSELLANKKDTI